QSRPTATACPPSRLTKVPRPLPSFSAKSGVKSRPTMPRMSYSRKICGFICDPSHPMSQPFSNELAQSIRIEGFFQPGVRNRVQELSRTLRKGAAGQEDHPLRTLGPNAKKLTV